MARYIPSGSSTTSVIQSLGDFISTELSLPGNWSSFLFFSDLKVYPVRSKRILAETLKRANLSLMSYLDFFEQTRGYSKNVSNFQRSLFSLFETGSIMLYFEDYFLYLLNKDSLDEYDKIVIKYIEVLGQQSIGEWDTIVSNLGACCYQFFAKEPRLYAHLVFRSPTDVPEDMTDIELLDALGLATGEGGLSPNQYVGKISIHDSRSDLIKLYRNQINMISKC